jgi:uncharacterized Ntn-hydrolase superfamily protein
MTFSVVGRSPDGRSTGVAVASKFLAVGGIVPAVRHGVGAIATQSLANTLYKREGLRLLSGGCTAAETLSALLAEDDGRGARQVGIVDAAGRSATWTGDDCLPWAGGVTGDGYAIQGNLLAGPEVVQSMERAWLDGETFSLSERLLATVAAGDLAGGDSRGRQSAGLLVAADEGSYTAGDDMVIDLRVDDHRAPVLELGRLLELHHVYFDPPDESKMLPLRGALEAEVERLLQVVGQPDLYSWAGVENFEMRLRDGLIDPFLLRRLREEADHLTSSQR